MPLTTEEKIASIAINAMLQEVATTPKPGLVDCNNSGAHTDMDIYTFFSSASVLQPYFTKMGETGANFTGEDFTVLLKEIRPIGIDAEKSMFSVTNGVNTHKGLIFSLGILCSATAYIQKREKEINTDEICSIASKMCRGIIDKELKISNNKTTIGEKLFAREGVRGIRGEAESGFPSVTNLALPYLRKSKGEWNNRLVNTLLHLMTIVEDSNIIGRHNKSILLETRNQAKEVLDLGGASDDRGMEIIKQMDLNHIDKKISPGGSADLLAVTIFLYKIENTGW